jgi:hypothetical protein
MNTRSPDDAVTAKKSREKHLRVKKSVHFKPQSGKKCHIDQKSSRDKQKDGKK